MGIFNTKDDRGVLIGRERIKQIIAERDAAFTILKQLEFGNAVNGHKCLICVGWDVGPNGETPRVHTKDCPLGKLLAKGMTP